MTTTDGPITRVLRADERFSTTADGLQSRHSFSFGAHYDPSNVSHGRLLVNNDESVRSGMGFDTHPHQDAEIVTWVLSGSLLHQDSQGHRGVIYPGLAQRMSAGSGILHSERNDAYRVDPTRTVEPVRFIQMWLMPDDLGADPFYMQRDLDPAEWQRDWLPIASGSRHDAAITIGSQGSTLWVSTLDAGTTRTIPAAELVHLYVATGTVGVETVGTLRAGDSLRVTGEAPFKITGLADEAAKPAELLVWGMDR